MSLKFYLASFSIFFSLIGQSAFANNIQILDSSQISTSEVNRLGAIVESSAITLGTVIVWPNESDPPDNNCVSSVTGGNGEGGKCKWLECNGQRVNEDVYTEYGRSKLPVYRYTPSAVASGSNQSGTYTGSYTILKGTEIEIDYITGDSYSNDGLLSVQVYDLHKHKNSRQIEDWGEKISLPLNRDSNYQSVVESYQKFPFRHFVKNEDVGYMRFLIRVSN